MKIFAIVVTYNGMRWYDRCFGSLRDSDMSVETIVIDNASTDETVSYIKEHFPEICILESKENLGFAKANNIGIKQAIDSGADYVFLLNQDAWVEKDTLTKLVQTFEENENVGIASPIHLNGEYTGLDWGFVNYVSGEFVSDSYMQKLKKFYSVKFVNAAAWLINAECVRNVGGFDTLLFVHYGEDRNYCQRVLYHGYKIVINTSTSICHDRNMRKEKEKEYRRKVFAVDPFLTNKVSLGDINQDVDISNLIKVHKRSVVKSFLKLSKNGIVEHKKTIAVLKMIEMSRRFNMERGEIWL